MNRNLYRKKYNISLFYGKVAFQIVFVCVCILQIYCASWGETIYRFSKEYWEKIEKPSELTLEGKEWEKSFDKNTGIMLFSTTSPINLGVYQFVHIYVASNSGYEVKWGWSSKKWDDKIYFPSEGIRLINDNKIHTYSFALRFTDRENPIFDKAGKVWVEIKGLSNENDIELSQVVFIPYDKKHPRQLTMGGVCMDVLWDEKMIFNQKIEQGMELVFYTGIYNPILGAYKKVSEGKDWQTDGISFSIDVVSEGNTEKIYQSEMRPQMAEEDRNWKRVALNLARYAGKEIEFIFQMTPINNPIGDFGVWGNPMLVNTIIGDSQDKTPFFIISCDTLRPDHLLPYGYYLPTSPHLDAFAKDAVVFENAYTTQTFTPVAHMSILTGRYPEGHGLTRNTDVFPYVETLPELMRNYGYMTAGFAGFWWWKALCLLTSIFVIIRLFFARSVVWYTWNSDRLYHYVVNQLSYGLRLPFTKIWLYTWKKPQRGDIVAYITPKGVENIPSELVLCGMVVGIEGDKVSIQNDTVLINGKELTDTPFPLGKIESPFSNREAPYGSLKDKEHSLVPVGNVFVIWNFPKKEMEIAIDSRTIGWIPESYILGKLSFIWWPLTHWKKL